MQILCIRNSKWIPNIKKRFHDRKNELKICEFELWNVSDLPVLFCQMSGKKTLRFLGDALKVRVGHGISHKSLPSHKSHKSRDGISSSKIGTCGICGTFTIKILKCGLFKVWNDQILFPKHHKPGKLRIQLLAHPDICTLGHLHIRGFAHFVDAH